MPKLQQIAMISQIRNESSDYCQKPIDQSKNNTKIIL